MAVTTTAAIRDVMVSTVKGLTPSTLQNVRYVPHSERVELRTFAEENPHSSFRRYSIKSIGLIEPPVVSNLDREWVETEIELEIAYPRDHRYGAQLKLDLDDVVELDLRQIEHAIGSNGYATLDLTTGGDAAVTTVETMRDDGGGLAPVVYGVIRLRAGYWRAMG